MEKPRWAWGENAPPERRARRAAPGDAGGGRGPERLEGMFKAADKDGDGKLSAAEYPQPGVFKEVDANADGAVTLEEARAYYRGRRQQGGTRP
jgi:hypothetical protein